MPAAVGRHAGDARGPVLVRFLTHAYRPRCQDGGWGAMRRFLDRLGGWRASDRRPVRPPGLVYWTTDTPSPPAAIGLALQHLAIQSVYLVFPAVMAGALTGDPALIARYVSLSILATAIWQVLQLLPRGPIGAGYAIPACSVPALIGAFAIAGREGTSFEGAAAMVLVSGLICAALGLLLRRPRLVLPNELAGVVVVLIGVALVLLGAAQLGLTSGGMLGGWAELLTLVATLAVTAGTALSRTRAAPLAVLVGAVTGTVLALLFGQAPAEAGEILAAQPWLAMPEPWTPRFDEIRAVPMLAFLVALIAVKASIFGSLVVFQRAADAAWTRPDAPPIRRGFLANGLGIMAAGALGGALPGPSNGGLGLSVATGTLARRIAWIGSGLLLLLAFCPKLVALFVLMPAPVKGAILLYVAGFLIAQGCQVATARLLDTRRSLILASGAVAGLTVAVAPEPFAAALPALASPLAFGASVALAVHLLTLPLVSRRARLVTAVDAGTARAVTEWFGRLGGAWGLKAGTVRAAENALTELLDLLAARRVAEVVLTATLAEDRVEIALAWSGPALADPAVRPRAEDVLGSDAAREGFAVWLATREAQGFTQRAAPGTAWDGREARLVFED